MRTEEVVVCELHGNNLRVSLSGTMKRPELIKLCDRAGGILYYREECTGKIVGISFRDPDFHVRLNALLDDGVQYYLVIQKYPR